MRPEKTFWRGTTLTSKPSEIVQRAVDTQPERVRATLRIYHPELNPEQITSLLEISPSVSWRKGDDAYGWTKKPGKKAPSGGWLLSSRQKVKSNNAIAHLEWLMDQLLGSGTVLKQLQDQGFMVDVVVGWHATSWNTTPALTPDIMRRLANQRLPIWFDVYLYDDEDI